MKPKVLITLVALLVLASTAMAQSAQGYDLTWWTVDNGGHTSSAGGSYTLGGAIGQPDAATLSDHASGVTYTLAGGFWHGARIPTPSEYNISFPIVMHNAS